MINNLIM